MNKIIENILKISDEILIEDFRTRIDELTYIDWEDQTINKELHKFSVLVEEIKNIDNFEEVYKHLILISNELDFEYKLIKDELEQQIFMELLEICKSYSYIQNEWKNYLQINLENNYSNFSEMIKVFFSLMINESITEFKKLLENKMSWSELYLKNKIRFNKMFDNVFLEPSFDFKKRKAIKLIKFTNKVNKKFSMVIEDEFGYDNFVVVNYFNHWLKSDIKIINSLETSFSKGFFNKQNYLF